MLRNLGLPTADAGPVFCRAFFSPYSLYVYYDLYGLNIKSLKAPLMTEPLTSKCMDNSKGSLIGGNWYFGV